MLDTYNYWTGPYGIRVHNSINSIVAIDGGNTLYKGQNGKSGRSTEMFYVPLSKNEYLEKYATFGDDDYFYWKEDLHKSYWLGPYGILVPNNISEISAGDNRNTMYKGGGTTKMVADTEEEYLLEYGIFVNGRHYWHETKFE